MPVIRNSKMPVYSISHIWPCPDPNPPRPSQPYTITLIPSQLVFRATSNFLFPPETILAIGLEKATIQISSLEPNSILKTISREAPNAVPTSIWIAKISPVRLRCSRSPPTIIACLLARPLDKTIKPLALLASSLKVVNSEFKQDASDPTESLTAPVPLSLSTFLGQPIALLYPQGPLPCHCHHLCLSSPPTQLAPTLVLIWRGLCISYNALPLQQHLSPARPTDQPITFEQAH
ncbi:hypothetical protein PTTG_25738 [Puccinia triticina 1-1 BBBD Race 1]|uniref:Uncharacterized protein n=1 Tax=Puccinia triticina (isolate 1-1 / race 1 (BBBD)) TaxID=630390 RepID=A0A180H1Q4_PUCT1|nr:hypothetical protein PTTG_25738 [Puccinia triticina 1-1 BBBD Race 1]